MRSAGIRTRLLLLLLGVAVPAVAVVGWLAYARARSSLERSAFDRLTSLRASRARQIEAYFRGLTNQAATLAQSTMTLEALHEFQGAFHELDAATTGEASLRASREALKAHYENTILPHLREGTGRTFTLEEAMPVGRAATWLQAAYIPGNPFPTGRKDELDFADDASHYSEVHRRWHPRFRDYVRRFGLYDLFLIDGTTHEVVYSVFKEIDFASNLDTGIARTTALARVRNDVCGADAGTARLVDFERYVPSFGAPAAFVASPIREGDSCVGYLAFQVPISEIDRVMTAERRWKEQGLGETGETYLVGSDLRMRSNSRFLIETPDAYFAALKRLGTDPALIDDIRLYGTSILFQTVDTEASRAANQGKFAAARTNDYRGEPVLSSYQPLAIDGVQWVLLSEIDADEALAPAHHLAREVGLFAALTALAVAVLAFLASRRFVRPIRRLEDGVRRLESGERDVELRAEGSDEVAHLTRAFNEMVRGIRSKEATIEEKNRENEELLLSILPPPIAARLKANEGRIADAFARVSVLFADMVGFTDFSKGKSPAEVVAVLDETFSEFDRIAHRLGVEKIKTIGDAYMCVCGLPTPREDHADRIADMALDMLAANAVLNERRSHPLEFRIGINTGPVVAGVIGTSKFIYDLWGDTVNIASRMESSGVPGRIHATAEMAEALRGRFAIEERGEMEIKGGGRMRTYLLTGRLEPD
jgi:class 3 adenylate cyclase